MNPTVVITLMAVLLLHPSLAFILKAIQAIVCTIYPALQSRRRCNINNISNKKTYDLNYFSNN